MKIAVINPNTTESMTRGIERAALSVAGPGVEIVAVTSVSGPVSIESHYDEALCVPGLLTEIARLDGTVDAVVLACFGDPGLDAARELSSVPVIGIAEAGMHVAALIGRSFSIMTSLSRTLGRAEDLAQRYGAERSCRGMHAADIPVLDLEDLSDERFQRLLDDSRRVLEIDGSDSLLLGCAGLADMAERMTTELNVPVIDGVAAAVSLAQALVAMKLSTSRHDEYAAPLPKPYRGDMAHFALHAASSPS